MYQKHLTTSTLYANAHLSIGSVSLLAESKLSLSMPNPIPLLLMTMKIIGSWYLKSRYKYQTADILIKAMPHNYN